MGPFKSNFNGVVANDLNLFSMAIKNTQHTFGHTLHLEIGFSFFFSKAFGAVERLI
jgi:hypothetical protein